MLAKRSQLKALVKRLKKPGLKSVDTETTGLFPHNGDRLFSIIICDEEGPVYFNFKDYPDENLDSEYVLDDPMDLAEIFENHALWFMQNAKFDLHMLRFAGIEVRGVVHCTLATAQVLRNDRLAYGLDVLLKDLGLAKNDGVKEYIAEHKLFDMIQIPGKKKRERRPFYDRVPLMDIMLPYGLDDASGTRALGLSQLAKLEAEAAAAKKGQRNVKDVYLNETRITRTLFEMEWNGVNIDPDFVERARESAQTEADAASSEFKELTGVEFKDSGKALAAAFDAMDEPYPRKAPTEKMREKGLTEGNPTFAKEVLENMDTPAAALIKRVRKASQKVGTYYSSYQHFQAGNVIHCDYKQNVTTGRKGCSNPNMQNVPKRGEDLDQEFVVRRSFIPPEDYCFVMMDYDQMEYRVMLDYAQAFGVLPLVDAVLGGLDIHTATAEILNIPREFAKTINFMLIYGGGAAKFAKAIGVSVNEGKAMKQKYFSTMPAVQKFIRMVIKKAELGKVRNWLGRTYYFDDKNFAYKAPNYLIQGGCADVVKVAMNGCHDFLNGRRSYMQLQIHDELLFAIHKDEFDIVPSLKEIMESAYPYQKIPLTVGVDHSWKSWADKVEGYPVGKTTGDSF